MWLAMVAGIATCLLVIRLDGMYWLRYPAQWHTVARHWFAFESDYQKCSSRTTGQTAVFWATTGSGTHARPSAPRKRQHPARRRQPRPLICGGFVAPAASRLARPPAAPGCEPISYPARDRKCLTAGQALRERLSQHRYQTVILAGYWYHTPQQISRPGGRRTGSLEAGFSAHHLPAGRQRTDPRPSLPDNSPARSCRPAPHPPAARKASAAKVTPTTSNWRNWRPARHALLRPGSGAVQRARLPAANARSPPCNGITAT